MARRTFLYYLFSKDKKPLYVDDNNQVVEGDPGNFTRLDNGQQAHLKFSPDGWKDTLVKFFRNAKYWGMFRDMTVPMKFTKDGLRIMRNRMWLFGVECICYLGIEKFDATDLPYTYKPWYLSEINFAKYRESETQAQVEALEGGLSKILKSSEDTVVEIPIDSDPQHFQVKMDGKEFDFNRTLGIITDQEIIGTANFYLGMVETSREGNPVNMTFQDIFPKQSSAYPNDDWFYYNYFVNQVVRIHGKIKIFFNKEVPFLLRVETNDGATSGFPQYDLVNIAGDPRPAGTTEEFEFDQTFTVPAGKKINMKITGGDPEDTETQFTVKEGNILFDYVYRYSTTYANCIYLYRLLEKIVDNISNGKYGVKSDWLLAKKDIAVTCGDALRGLHADNTDPDNPKPEPVIKTSLTELFKALGFWGVRLSIEDDKMVIEPFVSAFQNTVIINLGKVSWR
jgi:hypothetical protein